MIAACAVACSLPLLIAAGGAAGIGALLGGMETLGIMLLAAADGRIASVWSLEDTLARMAQLGLIATKPSSESHT